MLNWFRKWLGNPIGRSLDSQVVDEDGLSFHKNTTEEWWVTVRDERVALLAEPQMEDMFWFSFKLIVLNEDPVWEDRLADEKFWQNFEEAGAQLLNRSTGRAATRALISFNPFKEPRRILIRGLV